MKTGYCPAASTLRPAMISYGLGKWNKDPLRGMPSLVFQPEPRRALSGFPVTKNLLMASPDNVQSKAFIYRYDQGTWRATPIPLPTNENVSLSAASEETDVVLFTVSNYLEPTPLWYFDAASEGLEILRTTPRPLQRSDRAGGAVRMFRFTKLGAGSSYIGEYGDPAIRAARVDRGLLTLSEACPGQDLPRHLHSHFHQGRPRACGARPPLGVLRSASPITAMRITTADIARPPSHGIRASAGTRIHLCIQAACGLSAVDE